MSASKQDAINFLYKHGDLTHSASAKAINLLTNNGFVISVAKDNPFKGRWRVFESIFDRTHFGIELEDAGNDDDPILYSMKIKRETVQAIVDAHNASIAST